MKKYIFQSRLSLFDATVGIVPATLAFHSQLLAASLILILAGVIFSTFVESGI